MKKRTRKYLMRKKFGIYVAGIDPCYPILSTPPSICEGYFYKRTTD